MTLETTTTDDLRAIERALADARAELALARERNARLETERLELIALFEGSRDAIWTWDTAGTITRWNAAAERLLGYRAEEIVGASLLGLIPPDRQVKAREIIDTMARGAAYRQWETIRIAKDGTAVAVELTVSPMLGAGGAVVGASTVCRDMSERRLMAENAPVMLWMSDRQGKCVHLNRMLRAFWGLEGGAVDAFDWSRTMHPDDAPRIGSAMSEALASRCAVVVKGRYRDARGRYRVLETCAHPRFSDTGEFLGMIGANVDITDQDEAERARELLVAELNHRVKNTLAIVQGIAHQTFRSNADPVEARRAFEGRLIALANAHNLLTQANWENASLEKLAELTLNVREINADRVSLSGPPILLSPKQAVTIGIALYELRTNARKYGALSNEDGRVTLAWAQADGAQPQLRICWRESGGPAVAPPRQRGFGSLLLERTLAADLDGTVKLEFEPSGLICTIEAPLAAGRANGAHGPG